MVADTSIARSIQSLKHTQDKIHALSDNQGMLLEGDTADCKTFGEFIKRNIILQKLKQNRPLSTTAVANFTRNELATALRKAPKQCNALIGGVDYIAGRTVPKLYSLDYLGSLVQIPFCASGYAQYFVLSLMDRQWEEGMTSEQLQNI